MPLGAYLLEYGSFFKASSRFQDRESVDRKEEDAVVVDRVVYLHIVENMSFYLT